jgi:hypothetical protein
MLTWVPLLHTLLDRAPHLMHLPQHPPQIWLLQ